MRSGAWCGDQPYCGLVPAIEDLVLPDGTRNSSDPSPERARRLAVLITLCLQASLLVQHSPAVVAEAFLGSRFGGDVPGWTSLPARSDTRLLVERVTHRWG